MPTAPRKAPEKSKSPILLIVDDSPVLRECLRERFSLDGFAVCAEAGNGSEAIEKARECKPDVIILDLSMPVMSGIEAAPILKRLLPNTPIILFTLFGDEMKHLDLSSSGISATFSKTDSLDDLFDKVRELLGP